MDELASLDQSNAESPLERFRRIELYIAGWKNLRRLKRQIPKLQQHNCGIWAKILPPLVSPFLGPGAADSVRF
jgi:hypothetical protein